MTPTEELLKRIEKLRVTKCWTDDKDPCPYKYYSKDCATKTERIIDQINKAPVLTEIKSFLKDYKLVKKGDLLTEKELDTINNSMRETKYNRAVSDEEAVVLKKLKALGGSKCQ